MAKWTTADIPDQTGRVAVITGANTGLGYETALALAEHGAHVVLAVRNLDKGKDAAARITASGPHADVALQELDLTSLESIRAAARATAVRSRPHRPADQQRRRDVDTEVDHQGRLRAAVRHQPPRPLRLHRPAAGSAAAGRRFAGRDGQQHRPPHPRRHSLRRPAVGAPLQPGRGLRAVQAGQPAVHLRTAATAGSTRDDDRRGRPPRRLAHRADPQPASRWSRAVYSALEPLFAQDAAAGALPTLRAATDPAVLGGQYYGPDGLAKLRGHPKLVASSEKSHDVDRQRRLWAVSEELTGVTYPVG